MLTKSSPTASVPQLTTTTSDPSNPPNRLDYVTASRQSGVIQSKMESFNALIPLFQT